MLGGEGNCVVGEWVVSFLCGTVRCTRGGDVAADGDAARAGGLTAFNKRLG